MRLPYNDIHLASRRKFDGRVRIGTYDMIPPRACKLLATIKMYGRNDDDHNDYQLEERIRATLQPRRTKGGWFNVSEEERDVLAAWFDSINQWTQDWYEQAGNDAHPIRFNAALDKRLSEIAFQPITPQHVLDSAIGALSMSTG